MYWFILSLISWLSSFRLTTAISACDEVDITFLIDTPSIIQNGENVIDLILSIVWSGSSEYSGFSIVLYGDLIPQSIKNPNIISLTETVNIHTRKAEEEMIAEKLENIFTKIGHLSDIKPDFAHMKSVKLLDAFKIANAEISAKHKHKIKEKFKQYSNANERAYFIFDFDNTLVMSPYNDIEIDAYDIKNSNDDICSIFDHLSANDIDNNEESVHFLMGQPIHELDVFCNGKDVSESLMNENTFFVLNHERFLENEDFMEQIFAITCPAVIKTPQFGGEINLGNHNQWIDLKTIIAAHFVYVDHDGDHTTPPQLSQESYVLIKDYINDDNTFKENDYLLADPKTYRQLKTDYKFTAAVVKIVRIVKSNRNNDNAHLYNILMCYVELPKSPSEYILDAKIEGDIPVSLHENGYESHNPYDNDSEEGSESESESESADTKRLLLSGDRDVVNNKNNGRNVKLFSMDWTKKYVWEKTGTSTVKIGGGMFSWGAPEVTITGRGVITLEAGYGLKVDVYAKFAFDWNRSQGKIYIDFRIHGTWEMSAWFYAKLTGTVEAAINNLVNWGKTFTFFAGPVPILFKPYVALNVRVITKPFSIYGGIKCTYKESFALGYHYEKTKKVSPKYATIRRNAEFTLWTRKTYDNVRSLTECTKLMYFHGSGSGRSCKWFDYNRRYGTCRCKGSTGNLKGYTKYSSGWTAYGLGMSCSSSTYRAKCSKCNSDDIAVEKTGGSNSECGLSRFNFWSESENWNCKRCSTRRMSEKEEINKYPIRERRVVERGCTKKFGIGDSDRSSRCPVTEFGFDVIIEPKIGVSLYVVINVYLKFAFVFPFRITAPEKQVSVCNKGSGRDMCQSKYLMASFTVAMRLDLKLGASLDIGALWGSSSHSWGKEFTVGSFAIMNRKSLGCLELSGMFTRLNSYLKSRCCSRSARAVSGIYDTLPNPVRFEDRYGDRHKQVAHYYGTGQDYYRTLKG